MRGPDRSEAARQRFRRDWAGPSGWRQGSDLCTNSGSSWPASVAVLGTVALRCCCRPFTRSSRCSSTNALLLPFFLSSNPFFPDLCGCSSFCSRFFSVRQMLEGEGVATVRGVGGAGGRNPVAAIATPPPSRLMDLANTAGGLFLRLAAHVLLFSQVRWHYCSCFGESCLALLPFFGLPLVLFRFFISSA